MGYPGKDQFFVEFANIDNFVLWALKRWGLMPANADGDAASIEAHVAKTHAQELMRIGEEQEKLRTVLDAIIETGEIKKTEELARYLAKHSQTLDLDVVNGQIEYVLKDGLLAKALYGEDTVARVARSLVSFLRSEDITRLRKCRWCTGFFLRGRVDQIYCNKKCRYANDTHKKVKSGRAAETMRRLRAEHPEKYA